MSTKEDILNNVKRNIKVKYDMPDIDAIEAIQYPDKIARFIEISKGVGGEAQEVASISGIDAFIKERFPDAKRIASNLSEVSSANINPDTIDDPHALNGVDLAVIRGEVGVAENGCVWIPQNVKHKVIYFIAEYLIIVLDKKKIVNNMHEAYGTIDFHDQAFGAFISGPSKTADIEQALVVGAHGAKGVTVLLI